MDELSGAVENIIFASDDGRFSVFRLKIHGQKSLATVTLPSAPPLAGQEVELKGTWVEHPRFGSQFKATHIKIAAPSSAEGIERFLASGVITGVGKAMAKRLVKKFGVETLDVIEHEPSRLREIPGIGKKTAKKIHDSYAEQSELRDIMLWLESHGVSGTFAGRIYQKYGSFSINVLEQEPYRLASEVTGIGFLTADRIALAMDIEPDDEHRIAAGVNFTLESVASYGHVCVPAPLLMQKAAALLRVSVEMVRYVMRKMVSDSRLFFTVANGETLIYPHYLYMAETETARLLNEINKKAEVFDVDAPEALVEEWEKRDGIELAERQRDAIVGALKNGVFVLTGGPGTGKTTVVRGMLSVLERLGLTVELGAPTGRAAKRLAESTGREAQTVHRMLEAQGSTASHNDDDDDFASFARDEDAPLEADVIILDEVSMMDIVLMRHFLAAVPRGAHVIFVGDVDQLPAVGPGSVLKDILRSGVIPSVRLTEIFRQAEKSVIVMNAHAINGGRMPVCEMGSAFEFRDCPTDSDAAAEIVKLCTTELRANGVNVLRDVEVLSPMHRLECGVDNLNKLLQDALNPHREGVAEKRSGVTVFRVGDKVMQTKNNYQKHVFNGDVGFIDDIQDDGELVVSYDDGELMVNYKSGELIELVPAYAMSVHKSQGSEYPIIIMPLVMGHRIMMQRNLIYTAITRAKERVILVGDRRALELAVRNDKTRRRYTLLAERLTGNIE
ncbi:MAG: ATP-dependent RecD-like DNA helicase [Selenomonadaceae bacterium]